MPASLYHQELRLVHTCTVWTLEASRFESGIMRRKTGVFWPRLSLSYSDAKGCKNYKNITRALSRNAQPQHIRSLSCAFHGKLWHFQRALLSAKKHVFFFPFTSTFISMTTSSPTHIAFHGTFTVFIPFAPIRSKDERTYFSCIIVKPSSHFHGSVTVLIRDYPSWNRHLLATVVTFLRWCKGL